MMTLALIFVAGLIWDVLVTVDFIATAAGKASVAFFTTMVLTVLSCTMYNEVFVVDGWQAPRVITLALGSALGASGTIHFNNKRKGRTT